MKTYLASAAVIALSAGQSYAGGFERSGNPIGFLFEKGDYVELSFGYVSPSVSGTVGGGAVSSGSVLDSYTQFGIAIKSDLTDKITVGLQIDPSFGADVTYPTGTGYPLAGTTAELNGDTVAVFGRYKFNENFSAHAGIKSVGVGGNVAIVGLGPIPATTYAFDRDVGYLVGIAYEKPEIALRVGLTYSSDTSHDMATNLGPTVTVELPKSLTLDFQSGVAANTLVFGSIRWVDWTATELVFPVPLVGYDNDTITYNIGVGRKFNDQWSGAVSLGYERLEGGTSLNLAPTDGYVSLGLGATYTQGNMKITGGIRYVDIGDATTSVVGGSFTDNDAIGVGIKVGFTF